MGIKTIELLEKVNELGFESIEEASDAGYEFVYDLEMGWQLKNKKGKE